ncbi:MAG: hypothetical protein ACRCWS_03875 [Propionibacteriaceae bacterium]
MAITDEEHVLLTSFAPAEVATVERIVAASDTRVGFWTPDGTELVARLAAGSVVTVQACSGSGKIKRDEPLFEAHAEVLTEGPLFDEVKAKTDEKYGVGLTLEKAKDTVLGWFGKTSPEVVVMLNIIG